MMPTSLLVKPSPPGNVKGIVWPTPLHVPVCRLTCLLRFRLPPTGLGLPSAACRAVTLGRRLYANSLRHLVKSPSPCPF